MAQQDHQQWLKEMRQIMKELAVSQKKTDAQLQENDRQMKEMRTEAKKEMKEIRAAQKATDRQLQATDRQLQATDRQLQATDRQLQATDRQLQETDRKLAAVGQQLGEMGLTSGKVTEDLFARNLKSLMKQHGRTFDSVRKRFKQKDKKEYDIVAINGSEILVIEVKADMKKYAVENFIQEALPRFKKEYPKYKKYRLYGGIAAGCIDQSVERFAERQGLYVLTQNSSGLTELANSSRFQAKVFG